MSNSYKLTPQNITQRQIDRLIAVLHAANPVITDSTFVKKGVIAVVSKHHRALHQAMVSFDNLSE